MKKDDLVFKFLITLSFFGLFLMVYGGVCESDALFEAGIKLYLVGFGLALFFLWLELYKLHKT